jgi:hypothetical protein
VPTFPIPTSSPLKLIRESVFMNKHFLLTFPLVLCICALVGCGYVEERAAIARLKPTKDPVMEEIYAFRVQVRQLYNTRRFTELDKMAAELRRTKPLFGNGSWKIAEFYGSFECRSEEPESMWQLHDRIHQDWVAQFPTSITARVAYADFFTDYAWHARGTDFANKVTEEGWRLFGERLRSASKTLADSRELTDQDPLWWRVALQIALGQQWPKNEYDRLLEKAKASEPKFWGYDIARANSLLPRWYGKPGDWEAYAEQAAARPDGLGVEIYARIVMSLRAYYDNIFRETKASWPKVRQGLLEMRQKYPRSFDIINQGAVLSALGEDRALAKEMFDKLGDTYLPDVWGKPKRFVRFRKWAETGAQ